MYFIGLILQASQLPFPLSLSHSCFFFVFFFKLLHQLRTFLKPPHIPLKVVNQFELLTGDSAVFNTNTFHHSPFSPFTPVASLTTPSSSTNSAILLSFASTKCQDKCKSESCLNSTEQIYQNSSNRSEPEPSSHDHFLNKIWIKTN